MKSLYKILIILIAVLFVDNAYAQQQEINIANEYWAKGEKQKAYELFKSLAKSGENLILIHNNYLNILIGLSKFKEAEDHVERMIKREPSNLDYRVDLCLAYVKQGDMAKAEKYLRAVIKNNTEDPFRIKVIADHLLSSSLPEYAEIALKELRIAQSNTTLFALELANIYRRDGF
jgi:predicted Zn-dependent protease